MMRLRLELVGEAATDDLGARLAAVVQPGDFIGLAGDLGVGKTRLSRALCEALGVPPDQIASPTFGIVHAYEGGRLPVQHADLYRLADEDELYATGFYDLLGGPSLVLVEWIDRIPEAAPAEWLRIELLHHTPDSRIAMIEGFGPRGEALAKSLAPDPVG